jgi:threonine/homoserine/homoserine lactone efflux protein
MFDTIILKGIISGFTLAAPGEAVGFLEIKETEKNITTGIIAGLAAASADLFYGILAVIIFQLSSPYIVGDQPWLTFIGGAFLCAFGTKRFLDTPSLNKVKSIDGKPKKVFVKTFLFTLTNVSTILEFISLFIGFDIEFDGYYELLTFVIGVFLGSLVWWICVSIADEIVHKRISRKILRYLNYISGITIFCFGLYILRKLLIA